MNRRKFLGSIGATGAALAAAGASSVAGFDIAKAPVTQAQALPLGTYAFDQKIGRIYQYVRCDTAVEADAPMGRGRFAVQKMEPGDWGWVLVAGAREVEGDGVRLERENAERRARWKRESWVE